jgi:hypothetical protein
METPQLDTSPWISKGRARPETGYSEDQDESDGHRVYTTMIANAKLSIPSIMYL